MDKHIIPVVKCIYENIPWRRAILASMECFECGNCRNGDVAYFCLQNNDLVVDEKTQSAIIEKNRSGWKKGDPGYEIHRRKSRKEVEA